VKFVINLPNTKIRLEVEAFAASDFDAKPEGGVTHIALATNKYNVGTVVNSVVGANASVGSSGGGKYNVGMAFGSAIGDNATVTNGTPSVPTVETTYRICIPAGSEVEVTAAKEVVVSKGLPLASFKMREAVKTAMLGDSVGNVEATIGLASSLDVASVTAGATITLNMGRGATFYLDDGHIGHLHIEVTGNFAQVNLGKPVTVDTLTGNHEKLFNFEFSGEKQ
jgi:hypothetical protein